jgi:hypothetical protein
MNAQPEPRYEPRAWLVTLPNGWESLHIEHQNAIQYAARNHGTLVPLYRKLPDTPAQPEGKRP